MRLNFSLKPLIYREVIQCFLLFYFFLGMTFESSLNLMLAEEKKKEEYMTKRMSFPLYKIYRKC